MMVVMTDMPTEWDTITDESQTFTVSVPRGWRSQAVAVPTPAIKHTLVAVTSPDGMTHLHTGDADLPVFIEPQTVTFGVPPGMVARPGTPALQLLPEWVHYRYGNAPGFRSGAMGEYPPALQPVFESVQRTGMPLAWATSARLDYEFTDGARGLRAVLVMATFSYGQVWFAQVHGVTTTGDPEPFLPALLQMVGSARQTELERQRQGQQRMASAAQHQATMNQIAANSAMMSANHAQNMANISASGYAHQARMADLHASHDAHNAAWAAQQAGSDAQHDAYMAGLRPDQPAPGLGGGGAQQDFVNMIREERTVVDSEGHAHQVQAGYDRYFYRRHDGSMIGLQQHEQLADLGVNPTDYEEVRIQS